MSLPLVFRRIAQLELDKSVSWYEDREVGLGRQFRLEIDKYLERIANHPEQFRKIRGPIRRVVLQRFPYSIYFLPELDRIIILAVFCGRRAPQQLEHRFLNQD